MKVMEVTKPRPNKKYKQVDIQPNKNGETDFSKNTYNNHNN